MTKYIPLDVLVAEIERRIKDDEMVMDHDAQITELLSRELNTLYELSSFIKTLEVKEVDLEDAKKEELAQEYVDYTFRRHNIDPESKEGQLIYYAYMHGMNQCLNQLKAQKGE